MVILDEWVRFGMLGWGTCTWARITNWFLRVEHPALLCLHRSMRHEEAWLHHVTICVMRYQSQKKDVVEEESVGQGALLLVV